MILPQNIQEHALSSDSPHCVVQGQTSRALCCVCKTVVQTTFMVCDVPLSDSGSVVENLLVGVCTQCNTVVSIPSQSTPKIQAAFQHLRNRHNAPG